MTSTVCVVCGERTYDWEGHHTCKSLFYAWNDGYGTGGSRDATKIRGKDAEDAIEGYASEDFEFPDGEEYYVLDAATYEHIAGEHEDDTDDGTAVDDAMQAAATKYALSKEIIVEWNAIAVK